MTVSILYLTSLSAWLGHVVSAVSVVCKTKNATLTTCWSDTLLARKYNLTLSLEDAILSALLSEKCVYTHECYTTCAFDECYTTCAFDDVRVVEGAV